MDITSVKRIKEYTDQELLSENGFAANRLAALLYNYSRIYEERAEYGLDPNDTETYQGDAGPMMVDPASADPHVFDDPYASFSINMDSPAYILRLFVEAIHALCAIRAAGINVSLKSEAHTGTAKYIGPDRLKDLTIKPANPVSAPGYAGRRPLVQDDYYGFSYLNGKSVGLVPVQIKNGDSVQSIAARHMGDSSRYRLLVIVNGLNPPYISEEGDPDKHILGYGDSILVPAQVEDVTSEATSLFGQSFHSNVAKTSALFPRANYVTDVDRFFGIDLYWDWTKSDLKVDQRKDFAVAIRDDQVYQFIRIYAEVERGTWRLDRSFGLLKAPGFMSRRIAVTMQKMAIERTFTADPRVNSVANCKVVAYGNAMIAVATVLLERIGKTATMTAELRK